MMSDDGRSVGPGEDDVACQTLEQIRFAGVDAEMMELHLRLGPGQRRRAFDRPRRPDACRRSRAARRASRRRHRPEGDARRRARRHAHAAAQREDRIEHGADRIGQRPRVEHRDRRATPLSAAEEARPVGLELRLADGFAFGDAQMRGPDFRLRRAPAVAAWRGCAPRSAMIFGLDEQLGEGRMGDVGAPAAPSASSA